MTEKKKTGTNLFKLLETDPELEEAGVWADYPGTQSRFRIRSDSGAMARKYRQKLIQERVDEVRQAGTEVQRVALTEIAELIKSDVLIAEWEGVLGDDDQPLEVTRENARLLIARLHRLAGWIEGEAAKIEPYLVRKDPVAAGNS